MAPIQQSAIKAYRAAQSAGLVHDPWQTDEARLVIANAFVGPKPWEVERYQLGRRIEQFIRRLLR